MSILHKNRANVSGTAEPIAAKGHLGAEIYHILKQRIVRWEYPPGRRLIEDELRQEFGVSRVPVREALSMLEEKNLVEKLPFRGCSVRQPDPTEIGELYDVRLALELFGVTCLATSGMDEQEWQSLYTLWTASIPAAAQATLAAGGQLDGYDLARHDEAFHERLAKATGNKTLWEQLRLIDERLFVVRVTDISSLERLQETCREHALILESIRAQDVDAARAALQRNIDGGRSTVEAALTAALARSFLRR